MKRTILDRRGLGYIDVVISVLVLVFLLVLAMSVWSMVTLKQDVRYICNELLATATATGKIGDEVTARYNELCEESGITPTVEFSATYFDASSKKVQYGKIIQCTVTCQMTLPGFSDFRLPIRVTVTESGLSRHYWK